MASFFDWGSLLHISLAFFFLVIVEFATMFTNSNKELYQQTEFHVIVKYFFHVRSYTHPKLYSQ